DWSAAPRVPDVDVAPVVRGSQPAAVGAEDHTGDHFLHGQAVQLCSGLVLPDLDNAACRTRRQVAPVRTEGYRAYPRGNERVDRLAGGGLPDRHAAVETGGGQVPPVGVVGDTECAVG